MAAGDIYYSRRNTNNNGFTEKNFAPSASHFVVCGPCGDLTVMTTSFAGGGGGGTSLNTGSYYPISASWADSASWAPGSTPQDVSTYLSSSWTSSFDTLMSASTSQFAGTASNADTASNSLTASYLKAKTDKFIESKNNKTFLDIDDDNVIRFRNNDVQELASRIIYLIKNPEFGNQMGKRARKKILELYSIDKFLGFYSKIYDILTQYMT